MTTELSASMNLLEEISAFCKTENIAESTFGKRAVNDGKFVARLKDGARMSAQFKAEKVIGPLTRALGKGGRLIGIHSYGNDPGMEVIQRALRKWLGKDSRDYNGLTTSLT